MKKSIFFLVFFSVWLFSGYAQEKETTKIACIGNSITFGAGIANPYQDSYPGILSQLLGGGFNVRNFGFSGRTLLNKGDYPYMREYLYQEALAFNPDIVTIKLGTNDSKPQNWIYKKEFAKDLEKMISDFQALPSRPKIYLCLPVPALPHNGTINGEIIEKEIIPIIRKIAQKKKIQLIDLHKALKPYPQYFPDCVHPNEEGETLIAKEIYRVLTGKEAADYTPRQAFPGKKTSWAGYDRYDFIYNGREAIVVAPKQAAPGKPWIWRPAFFGAFPSVDIALLGKGFHVAYYDLTHLYGSPRAIKLGTDFYHFMRRTYRFSAKVTIEGFSRGGLFALNWTAQNTDKVACVYVDAPVCNVLSWPGRKEKELWQGVLKEWNLTDEQMNSFKGNPIDQLTPLAKAGIPIISVCGDNDKVVPYNENMKVVRDRYQAMGGTVEVILKPGVGHHPHSLEKPEPVVDFILRHQEGYTNKQHIHNRGSLNNSYQKFVKEKKGCVAFLGGSITEMKGWRNMIQEDLKQRFPYTEFTFIDAGIASTGSTPHSFRLTNDVLSKQTPDLLFVEAAVNDDTNGFDYIAQTRGMEGIVRHALTTNPNMNIVMLHFIYDPFIEPLQKGKSPDVILNHERVANYYSIPSINLAQEIAERMAAKELTWEQFGGTHPSWEGHKYYAATLNNLFDSEWKESAKEIPVTAHQIPQMPLDKYSYTTGSFIDINCAKIQKGWKLVNNWSPSIKGIETRHGFVHVPMLEATSTGATLTLDFTGRAIGIFCVAGPQAATLEYSIDGSPYKKVDTYTQWSKGIYLPWVYLFETELVNKAHKLTLRIAKGARSECQIRNFVVN